MTVIVASGWQLLFKGGPMMWPILLLSVVVLAAGIQQMAQLGRLARDLNARQAQILDALRRRPLKDAVEICESKEDLMGEVLKAGILKFGTSRDMVVGVMEETFARHVGDIHIRLSILSFTTNAAPLIGLLGTVNALIVLFQAAQMRSNTLSSLAAGDMAAAVWQALFTTAAGTFVGIISFVLYSFCAFRMNMIGGRIEAAIVESAGVLQQMSELQTQAGEGSNENI